MTNLFLDVLNTSVSAIWVVLGVILARLLLKKAPRWMVCSLWVLVALRLIFGGIEAPFSLIPSQEIIPPESLFDQAPEIHTGISGIDNAINPIYSESLRPAPGASVNPLQVWLAVFANLWVLGMAAMALWALLSCLRIRRQVRESAPLGDNVYVCDRIPSPFLFGLLRPKIYLPSGLDESIRTHVLAHERAHLLRRDHWWKPLGFILLTVHWFNPALWLCYILLCRDIELACDERVARNLPLPERKAYSAALLECSLSRHTIAACPLAFGEVGIKQRVKSVLSYKRPTFWVILMAVFLSIALAAGLLTDPKSKSDEIPNTGFPGEQPQDILYRSAEYDNLTMTLGVPDSWTSADLPETVFGGRFGLRCRPAGTEDWMDITFYDTEDTLYYAPLLDTPITLPSGATGSLYHSSDPTHWELIILHTARGQLHVTAPDNIYHSTDWSAEDYQTALKILETLALTEEGISLFILPTASESPLGISLSLQNLTPNGATLVCTQDGALWDEIITGAPWNLERQENGQWITIMPESTVWTTEAYLLQPGSQNRWNLNWNLIIGSLTPGHYRISKNFRGERNPPFTLGLEGESAEQTCYVEFTIHPPETAQFSPQLYQALLDDWKAFEALSDLEKTASSSTPGCCTRQFDSWTEVEQFVGMTIPAPLDGLDSLEKGNWAAMPAGYNGAPHYCITFYGTRDGYIQWVMVESGYRRDEMRIGIRSRIDSQSPEHSSQTIITSDRGDDYEARTATLQRGSIQYSIRVMGDPGTGNQLSALLDELLPHFENIMA